MMNRQQFVTLTSFAQKAIKYKSMERIEALISKLKEQFDAKADPALLLGTAQLLQFELTKLKSNGSQSLGTAKVAVVLPVYSSSLSSAETAAFEKYAPRPKETIMLVEPAETIKNEEKAPIAVAQPIKQLDISFDPMSEIPTLSHQPMQQDSQKDKQGEGDSLNDRLKQAKPEIIEFLKEVPVKDLRKAVGINDRFIFISELFRGDEAMYERSIKTINGFNIFAEAEYWISRELKLKLGWNNEMASVKQFDQLVKRRFS